MQLQLKINCVKVIFFCYQFRMLRIWSNIWMNEEWFCSADLHKHWAEYSMYILEKRSRGNNYVYKFILIQMNRTFIEAFHVIHIISIRSADRRQFAFIQIATAGVLHRFWWTHIYGIQLLWTHKRKLICKYINVVLFRLLDTSRAAVGSGDYALFLYPYVYISIIFRWMIYIR